MTARLFLAAAIAGTSTMAAAAEQGCDIEHWRYQSVAGSIIIDGTSNCREGRLTLRAYDGDSYLGNATGYLRGHAFTVIISGAAAPAKMQIKYVIEPTRR